MSDSDDLTVASSHFAFGSNWASYARLVGENEVLEARNALERLLGHHITGARFLDIGCGSGIHSLAAAQLGASEIVSVDIDPDSVATTRALLKAHDVPALIDCVSVFEMNSSSFGLFDIVYSWGVLHHTGDLSLALRRAAALVKPGGVLCLALYRKTWMCPFWRWGKRLYKDWPEPAQSVARSVYTALFAIGKTLKGVSFRRFVESYRGARGMDFQHDVHDWMGGYPYESILPEELHEQMRELGFENVLSLVRRGRIFGRTLGLMGSGCDEFVYRAGPR